NIDEISAQELGIHCFNAGEANSDAVGEHTLAMLLGLLTRLPKANAEVKSGKWDREGNRGFELKGKTVGIVGYGNTGSAVAQKLKGFGVDILAYDKYKSGFGDDIVTEVSEQDLLRKSDVITLHIPLTDETKLWLNKSRLDQCKEGIYLLNLSRGMVLDLVEVERSMNSGKILGFAADVLSVEPPWNDKDENRKLALDRLMDLNHTIFSPHVGGWTVESYRKISVILFDKMLKLYDIQSNL
ncbi:MAG: phosphoglycerate dehydrogenase, partial [Bacteroidetes bacterium]|nr:phosphoglycerate dehydrogenase [Bacteroidota bacterium]